VNREDINSNKVSIYNKYIPNIYISCSKIISSLLVIHFDIDSFLEFTYNLAIIY
jgi:hypothetical protein